MKPSLRRHALCASMKSAQFSSPLIVTHSSRFCLVSGHLHVNRAGGRSKQAQRVGGRPHKGNETGEYEIQLTLRDTTCFSTLYAKKMTEGVDTQGRNSWKVGEPYAARGGQKMGARGGITSSRSSSRNICTPQQAQSLHKTASTLSVQCYCFD